MISNGSFGLSENPTSKDQALLIHQSQPIKEYYGNPTENAILTLQKKTKTPIL